MKKELKILDFTTLVIERIREEEKNYFQKNKHNKHNQHNKVGIFQVGKNYSRGEK